MSSKTTRIHRLRWVVGFVLSLALVVALGRALLRSMADFPRPDVEYVALGSSFAAGPGIARRAVESYFPCMQSDANYGRLFAARENLGLNDVTCSGATTRDILNGGQFFRPAQISAIQPHTKLVTVTVGGNDVGYIGSLVSGACQNDPKSVPLFARLLGFCRAMPKAEVQDALTRLPQQLKAIIDQTRSGAPEARVVFIDYATVLPDTGTCPQLHLTAEQADAGREISRELEEITEQVAVVNHADLIKASSLTRGHDVCSVDPWVNGFVFPRNLRDFGPAAFHPKEAAMRIIADALAEKANDARVFFGAQQLGANQHNHHFVKRLGHHLTLNGEPYGFGEINAEWLGQIGFQSVIRCAQLCSMASTAMPNNIRIQRTAYRESAALQRVRWR